MSLGGSTPFGHNFLMYPWGENIWLCPFSHKTFKRSMNKNTMNFWRHTFPWSKSFIIFYYFNYLLHLISSLNVPSLIERQSYLYMNQFTRGNNCLCKDKTSYYQHFKIFEWYVVPEMVIFSVMLIFTELVTEKNRKWSNLFRLIRKKARGFLQL